MNNLDLAKATLDEMFVQIERKDSGEISDGKFDVIQYRLSQKKDSLRLQLDENEREEFKKYSLKRFDEKYPEGNTKVQKAVFKH